MSTTSTSPSLAAGFRGRPRTTFSPSIALFAAAGRLPCAEGVAILVPRYSQLNTNNVESI